MARRIAPRRNLRASEDPSETCAPERRFRPGPARERLAFGAAVKIIEGRERALETVETPGAKGIIRDLERLEKLIQSNEIGGEAVKKVVASLGQEPAGRSQGARAGRTKNLGEALRRTGK